MEEPNIEQLRIISLSLLKSVEGFRAREVTGAILSSLGAEPRIKLLRGFRGVGKTTAMLQSFGQNQEKALYFSADNPAVKSWGLYNTAKAAVKSGYPLLFIDEVHTYPEWRQEIKALHDELPQLRLVASGSAPLALVPERREELVCLHEMGLREFLLLKTGSRQTSEEEWRNKEASLQLIASNPGIDVAFQTYLKAGGFPLSIGMDEGRALDAIYHSVRKSVREDAVFFLKMSKEKVFAMESLLNMLATSKPGELSVTSLSSSLHASKSVVYEIIDALMGMEIIRVIRPYARGAALVRAEPKLLFFHPNMRFAVCRQLGFQADKGAVREELAVFGFSERGWSVHTIKGEKKSPDYVIERTGERLVVEIGGERKGRLQLKGFPEGLVIGEYQLLSLLLVEKKSKIA
jgi:predicted AAA+ superfamily ATPase